jgi:hypothetical protein
LIDSMDPERSSRTAMSAFLGSVMGSPLGGGLHSD